MEKIIMKILVKKQIDFGKISRLLKKKKREREQFLCLSSEFLQSIFLAASTVASFSKWRWFAFIRVSHCATHSHSFLFLFPTIPFRLSPLDMYSLPPTFPSPLLFHTFSLLLFTLRFHHSLLNINAIFLILVSAYTILANPPKKIDLYHGLIITSFPYIIEYYFEILKIIKEHTPIVQIPLLNEDSH